MAGVCILGGMENNDARSLSEKAQADLRRRVVRAVRGGLSQAEAARLFGVARGTVNRWMGLWQRHGAKAFQARRRGRPPRPRLTAAQAATAVRLIVSRCSDPLRLPFALWTREAVQPLLARRFGVRVSVWTVGRYLRAWGLTPQKPVRQSYEQDLGAVQRWLEEEYPAMRAPARREKAQIHWLDERGCVPTTRRAGPGGDEAKRRWCREPDSASAATGSRRSPTGDGWPSWSSGSGSRPGSFWSSCAACGA